MPTCLRPNRSVRLVCLEVCLKEEIHQNGQQAGGYEFLAISSMRRVYFWSATARNVSAGGFAGTTVEIGLERRRETAMGLVATM